MTMVQLYLCLSKMTMTVQLHFHSPKMMTMKQLYLHLSKMTMMMKLHLYSPQDDNDDDNDGAAPLMHLQDNDGAPLMRLQDNDGGVALPPSLQDEDDSAALSPPLQKDNGGGLMANVESSHSRSWITDEETKRRCPIVPTREVDLTANARSSPSRSCIADDKTERRCLIVPTRTVDLRQIINCPLVEVGSLTMKQNKDVCRSY
ncbi:hypothetical protein E5676_scaffold113G001570 [Cucumis melo var. makuwa]|uniref:Uncharacterized protein n=1 Tax=Cucumis melo var. makuwa TaxID=1194695 RepID=A0A5D3BQC5_CUCMM|nr:hypothetical protein E6C27_scaffold207G001710 [Cucumis melo var. makuwa]TYK01893.1 hypothetical protein E5676_scaffold113G001570 [Cucumis melo var. makuwa]